MKLAFSTNAFKRTTLADALETIARIGYSGAEVLADRPHAYPADLADGDVLRIKNLLAENSLEVSNVNAFTFFAEGDTYHPSWIEPEEALRERRVGLTEGAIDLAARLGAGNLSTEPGGPLPEGMSRREGLDIFAEGLGRCADAARARGVKILVEPEPGLLIETSGQIEEFLDRIDHPSVGLNCDLGHFFCVGEDPAGVVRRFAGRIGHVHLEDIASDRRHYHLVPGAGAMDIEGILSALDETGYDGFVTVELYPYEETPAEVAGRAYDYLAEIFPGPRGSAR